MGLFSRHVVTFCFGMIIGTFCQQAQAQTDLVLRDLRLRLISVQDNDPNDPRDDTARIMVRTATMATEMTVTAYTSEFVDEYEIYVWYVRANPERPGHGSARFTVNRDTRF